MSYYFVLTLILCIVAYVWHRNNKFKNCRPRFDGKVILITGASSGMGEEMAKQMSKLGPAKIILAARRVEELERVKREIGGDPTKIQVWQMDYSNPTKCLAEAEKFSATLDRLDVLVNNGGVSQR